MKPELEVTSQTTHFYLPSSETPFFTMDRPCSVVEVHRMAKKYAQIKGKVLYSIFMYYSAVISEDVDGEQVTTLVSKNTIIEGSAE